MLVVCGNDGLGTNLAIFHSNPLRSQPEKLLSLTRRLFKTLPSALELVHLYTIPVELRYVVDAKYKQ